MKKSKVVNNETDDSNFGDNAFYVEIELNDFIVPVEILTLKNIKADDETLKTIQVWKYENRH